MGLPPSSCKSRTSELALRTSDLESVVACPIGCKGLDPRGVENLGQYEGYNSTAVARNMLSRQTLIQPRRHCYCLAFTRISDSP